MVRLTNGAELEALRDSRFDAPDQAEQKAICREMQVQV
jgi:hypothetical protein